MGAAIYCRITLDDGTVKKVLVIARAKVCPVKWKSIPKLELEAAVIMTKLLVYAAQALSIPVTRIQPWTDSEIVLTWLQKMPCRLETFVANRTAFVLEALPHTGWRHVPISSNPADIASRGSTVSDLTSSNLWWLGPPWLAQPETAWLKTQAKPLKQPLPCETAVTLLAASTTSSSLTWNIDQRFSCYYYMVRILTWARRLVKNFFKIPGASYSSTLQYEELTNTKSLLLRLQQCHSFPEVFNHLKRKKDLPSKHPLAGLIVS